MDQARNSQKFDKEKFKKSAKKINAKMRYVAKKRRIISEQVEDILYYPGFAEAIKDARAKIADDSNDFDLESEAKKLMVEFNIETKWLSGLKLYLNSGNPTDLTAPLSIIIRTIPEKDESIKELSLVLAKDTTLRDVSAMWGEIEKYQAKMPGKTKKKNVLRRNRKRDREIATLREQGKSYKQIAEDRGISYDQVSTVIRNLRRRATGKS